MLPRLAEWRLVWLPGLPLCLMVQYTPCFLNSVILCISFIDSTSYVVTDHNQHMLNN